MGDATPVGMSECSSGRESPYNSLSPSFVRSFVLRTLWHSIKLCPVSPCWAWAAGEDGAAAACPGGRCRQRRSGAMLAAAPALLAFALLLLPLSLPTRSIIAINAGGETILAPDGQVFEEDR